MVKIIFLVVCFISAFGDSSTSTEIVCSYGDGGSIYMVIGNKYRCKIVINPNILTSESAKIGTIRGTHDSSKSNDDVTGIFAENKVIKYFPQDLHKFFSNLKAILISNCQLEEIRQLDLKYFPDLVYLRLQNNVIGVIEEGLFEFNPKLEYVQFYESKIIHIDPNVFDHLDNLRYFLLSKFPCSNQDISDSKVKVKEAIKIVKAKCVNSEFSDLNEKIKNLQIESKALNSQDLNQKLVNFEESFKNSKFSKFRPLNYKFETLKILTGCSNCTQTQVSNITSTDQKSVNLDGKLNDFVANQFKNISGRFEDLKSSQCGLKDSLTALSSTCGSFGSFFGELKDSQNKFESTLSGIKSSINDHSSKFVQLQNAQNQLKISQDTLVDSLSNLTTKFSDHKSKTESSQDEIKGSISDIEAILSNVKTSQTEVKSSLIKLKTSQNEIKIALDELKTNKNDNSEDKFVTLSEEIGNFKGKLENLEGHLMDFEVRNTEKFDKMEKEFSNTRHKISINFDEKIKGIEKRLMKKFEEILEEKLGKIFDEKLGNVLDAKSGTE